MSPGMGDLTPRVERVEKKVEELDTRVGEVEIKANDAESQLGRLTSHLASEVGLSRKDSARIERRLFGDEDDEYGGRLGQQAKRLNSMEIWFKAMIAASAIILFILGIYAFIARKP